MLSDPLQMVAIAIIGLMFVTAVFGVGKKSKECLLRSLQLAPNILTSLGIFFTFVGILISLSNF